MIRIEITRAILIPWLSKFSEKFARDNSSNFNTMTQNFLGNLLRDIWELWKLERKRISGEPQFRCYAGFKLYQRYMFQYNPYLISERRRNCSTLWPAQQRNRDSQETCYQNKFNINTCKNWWSNFSENLWNVALKLIELTRFSITKSINLL